MGQQESGGKRWQQREECFSGRTEIDDGPFPPMPNDLDQRYSLKRRQGLQIKTLILQGDALSTLLQI